MGSLVAIVTCLLETVDNPEIRLADGDGVVVAIIDAPRARDRRPEVGGR